MAFCYSLLKGRGGAGGYIRENGGQREVSGRDLPPGARCALYALMGGEYRLCGTQTADSGGNARWMAPKEGTLFLASGNKVLLWDGGDEAFLRASEWLDGQNKKSAEKTETEKMDASEMPGNQPVLPAETLKACMESARDHAERTAAPSYPFERYSHAEKASAKENPPERVYTLRPAGTGKPVDDLPERQRR